MFGCSCKLQVASLKLSLVCGSCWSSNMETVITGDNTCLAVLDESGYRLYSLNNVDDLELTYCNNLEKTCIVERMFGTNLLAIVALSSPQTLKVYHLKRQKQIYKNEFKNNILAVRMGRSRMVVCLEVSLCIYNIYDFKVIHTITGTFPNSQGLCALSTSRDNCLLAYPGSDTIGEVQIFDAISLQAKIKFLAHDSPLAALAFDSSGTRIATASEKGTMIRVFSSDDGQKLFEFRRGLKRCVDIYCLRFSTCSNYLCCSSNTETVHVFKLEEPIDSYNVEESSWMGYLSSYLPTQITKLFILDRAFALAHLPTQGVRNVASIIMAQSQLRLLVATEEGYVYIYNLDPNEGGELTLYKQHRLDHPREFPKDATTTNSQSTEGDTTINTT